LDAIVMITGRGAISMSVERKDDGAAVIRFVSHREPRSERSLLLGRQPMDVLKELAATGSIEAVSERLGITIANVEICARRLMKCLCVENHAQLIEFARKTGLLGDSAEVTSDESADRTSGSIYGIGKKTAHAVNRGAQPDEVVHVTSRRVRTRAMQARDHDRVRHFRTVSIRMRGTENATTGRTFDLSRGGVRVITEPPLAVGESVQLTWQDREPAVTVAGRVVHLRVESDSTYAGIQFDEPLSPEAFRALRARNDHTGDGAGSRSGRARGSKTA
jgi:hypothetical protein